MRKKNEVFFEDRDGKIWHSDDLDRLSVFEIEVLQLHVAEA